MILMNSISMIVFIHYSQNPAFAINDSYEELDYDLNRERHHSGTIAEIVENEIKPVVQAADEEVVERTGAEGAQEVGFSLRCVCK